MGHSRIAPSSAHRWVNCPGSVQMQERYPETEDSQDSKEGEASHWAGEQILRGGAVEIGQTAPNGIELTAAMINNAGLYTSDILAAVPADTLNIEACVKAPQVHPDSWGSPDCWAFDVKSSTLYIWDYKYGYGIVEAWENWQLINYAAGILHTLGAPDRLINVCMTVIQPRAPHPEGPIRRWTVPAEALRPYINTLHNAAHEALGKDPRIKSGLHCYCCTARHVCPSAHKSAMVVLDIVGRAEPHELDNAAIGSQLDVLKKAAKLLDYRLTALEAQAEGKIKRGESIPGWAMEPGKAGNLAWGRPEAEVLTLGDMLGVNISKPMTPTQAIAAGVPKDIIEAYASRSPGALKLTKADSTKAAKIFGGK